MLLGNEHVRRTGATLAPGQPEEPETMLTAEIIKALKAFNGPVYATALAANDTFPVRVYKNDLIEALKDMADNTLRFDIIDGAFHIDAA